MCLVIDEVHHSMTSTSCDEKEVTQDDSKVATNLQEVLLLEGEEKKRRKWL